MTLDKLNLSEEYSSALTQMLKNEGLSDTDINEIINGSYHQYNSPDDLISSAPSIFKNEEYMGIITDLADGYTLDEIGQRGTSIEKIESFKNVLSENDLTIENVKALNKYSSGSNMILGAKRGVPRESIMQNINSELNSRLTEYGFEQSQISQIQDMVNGLDYQKPVHENYTATNEFLEQMQIPKKFKPVVNSTVRNLDSYYHLDETLSQLDDGLQTRLSESTKLTRAVKSDFLTKRLADGQSLSDLVGRRIEENGYSSTSPLYDSSFAKYDDYDVVFDIYAPKGTQGSSITPFSSYGTVEEEVLLNSNDLYITDVIPGVIDKNGRTKTVLKSLALSKDKQCYKGIGGLKKEQEQSTQMPNLDNATREELIEMKAQAQQQSEFQQYRESLSQAYMQEKDSDTLLHSSFTISNDEKPQCNHRLEQIKGEERKTLQQGTFDYDENFRKNMLEPSIVDFAERNPIMSSDTRQNTQSQNNNSQKADYRAISETNNVLSVNNVEPEYANTIASAVQQVEPVIFQQQANQMAMQPQMGGPQMTLTMGGFIHTLGIAVLVGFGVGLLIALGIMIFNAIL